MGKYYFLIILTALFSCQKEEIEIIQVDNNLIDLHDTIISLNWTYGSVDYNLDIDNDSVNDIIITVFSHYSSFAGAENYIKVTPSNGFEIAFINKTTETWRWNHTMTDTLFITETVTVPKTFHSGDTITVKDMYSDNPQMIRYSYFPTGPGVGYYSGLQYGIKEDNYFCLGFCNIENAVSRLAWLKIKFFSSNIILNSGNYRDNEIFVVE